MYLSLNAPSNQEPVKSWQRLGKRLTRTEKPPTSLPWAIPAGDILTHRKHYQKLRRRYHSHGEKILGLEFFSHWPPDQWQFILLLLLGCCFFSMGSWYEIIMHNVYLDRYTIRCHLWLIWEKKVPALGEKSLDKPQKVIQQSDPSKWCN